MIEQWIPLITLGVNSLIFVFSARLLVRYRLERKFSKERKKGLWSFLEFNIVEISIVIMFIAIVVPDWASLILLR